MDERIKLDKNQKIVFLGCGSVAKCCIYYLNKFIKYKPQQVFIIDKDINTSKFPSVVEIVRNGATFLHFEIKRHNLTLLFDEKLKLKKDDIIIDLKSFFIFYF
jgi:homospermidine synthase